MQQSKQKTAAETIAVKTEQIESASAARGSKIRVSHVLILGGLGALGPLANDMYVPSLPALGHDLVATASQTQMTLSAFILGLALGQVVAGPISDALGRRRPLLIGVAAFALASLLCAAVPSIYLLIVLRFIQGIAGAAGIAVALAIISDLYQGLARARFLSVLMQINGLAPMIAPVVGGQLLRFTSWHGVFVAIALSAIVVLTGSLFGLGETLPVSQRQSGGLSTSLKDFRGLLLDRRFMGYALSCGFAFAACIIYISVSPFVLQRIYGVSPQTLGWIFGANALGIVIMAQVNSWLVGRVSSQTLLASGYSMLLLGGVTLLVAVLAGIGLVGILPAFFLLAASLGLIMANAATLALSTTRAAGSASGLLGVLQFAIGAIVAPLVGLSGSTSALPMAGSIAAFSLATLLLFLILCRPVRARIQSA